VIFATSDCLIQNTGRGGVVTAPAFALQFPKSQQLDLMAFNSGNPPSIDNFQLPPGYKIEPYFGTLQLQEL
jgi:hypothetical protein